MRRLMNQRSDSVPFFFAWKDDPAAMNIADHVISASDHARDNTLLGCEGKELQFRNGTSFLMFLNQCPLYAGDVIERFRPGIAMVLSMHRSEKGVPSLTVHPTGNIGGADYGGNPNSVSIAPALRMKVGLLSLLKSAESVHGNFRISYETTHHGPTVNVPLMFLEIGSGITEWTNRKAGEAVAKAAIEAAFSESSDSRIFLGLGGSHYAPFFTGLVTTKEVAVSHMVSQYHLPFLSPDMLKLLIQKTEGKVEGFALDWKGLRTEKANVLSLIEMAGLPYMKS